MQLHDDTHQYDIWTITATGKSANGHVTRTVSEDARASPTITPALPIYNYALYVGGSGTPDPSKLCKVGDLTDNSFVGGSFTATGNLWVGNNLCLGGGAKITLPTDDQYTLYLGGSLQTSGGSAVGEALPGNRLQVANIHGGCYDSGKKAVACSNTPKSSLFAHFANEGAASQTSGKPNIDWTVWTASNWKTPSCTPPPPHPVFEAAGDNAANPVPVSAVSISSVAYNCTFVDSTGSFLGSLQYQPAASSPTGHNLLTISGMVFINGNLDLGSSGNFQYQGNGTIYVNGTVSMQNAVCGYPATYSSTSCTGTWDQNQANMEIVAMNAGNCASTMTTPCTATGWTVNGVGEYDGVAFVRGTVTATGSGSTTEFKGPMITDFIDKINGGGGLYYPSQPPSESPGGVQHGSSWQVSPGTWRQLTN
jgi:hypothetical protein